MAGQTDGFKFAVTLLAAFGAVLLTVYDHFQGIAVDERSYVFAIKVLSCMILVVFFFVMYIFLKGYYFETIHPIVGDLARMMYEMAFLLFVSFVVYGFLYLVETDLPVIADIVIFIVMGIIFLIIIIRLEMKAQLHECPGGGCIRVALEGLAFFCMLLLCSNILFPVLFTTLSNSPLQGDAVIDMESINCGDDTQIPVFIKVTGLNTNILINLSKENSNHSLIGIDSIKLDPIHNPDKTSHGENLILVGNALGYGSYNVFINTTDLTVGYYELSCIRKDGYTVKGFYILNNCQQSRIK